MQQFLRGTVIFLMALAWPVHAQDNLPYTTYTSFDQLLEGRDARYPSITRVSHPGTSEHPVYTGFFFYQCLQFDTTGCYLLGVRVYFENRDGETESVIVIGNELRETRQPLSRIGILIGAETDDIRCEDNQIEGFAILIKDLRKE